VKVLADRHISLNHEDIADEEDPGRRLYAVKPGMSCDKTK
jgi:hypothetical protein